MVEFNKELETALPEFLEELRARHGGNLEGKRITVFFPRDGEDKSPKITTSTRGNGSKGAREGFPGRCAKTATLIDAEGKETSFASATKLAESLGLQVQGHRDMVDVFENPTKAVTKEELPKVYKVDAVKGEKFIVTVSQ